MVNVVLVLGGVIPYEKIRNTSGVVLTNNGIYTTSGAVRFTIFAVISASFAC